MRKEVKMKVSKVEIVPIRPNQGLVGFVIVEIDEQLLLRSIGIHMRKYGSGYRLTYPTRSSNTHGDPLFHPISPSLSKEIERCVFRKAKEIFNH